MPSLSPEPVSEFRFELTARDAAARTGILKTQRGEVRLTRTRIGDSASAGSGHSDGARRVSGLSRDGKRHRKIVPAFDALGGAFEGGIWPAVGPRLFWHCARWRISSP